MNNHASCKSAARRNIDQSVGHGKGAQNMRGLIASETNSSINRNTNPHEIPTFTLIFQRFNKNYKISRQHNIENTLTTQNYKPNQKKKNHKHRNKITKKTEKKLITNK